MEGNGDYFSSSHLSELSELIVNNLSTIVGKNTVLLYGQVLSSEIIKKYFIDSGAAMVLNLPLPEKQANCLTELFQIQNEGLVNPSEKIRNLLFNIDPQKEAIVYAGSSISAETMDDRKVIGRRLTVWREFEKKKYQTELTRKQDEYNPYYIDFRNDLQKVGLLQYCMKNRPCILSGDSKHSIAMGSDYVYLINDDTPTRVIHTICGMLYEKCEGVRISQFNDGLPATYYGFIAFDQIILYGPVEALVGFRNTDYKVVAPGILTPINLPEELLKKAKKDVLFIIKKLVDRTGYKGAFGIDGCFKRNSFIVHEINTRICAGFSLISKIYNNIIPLGIIDMIIREGETEKYKILLNIMQCDANKISLPVDIKLWENSELECVLRNHIPIKNNFTDLENWKRLVREKVLLDSTPFYSYFSK